MCEILALLWIFVCQILVSVGIGCVDVPQNVVTRGTSECHNLINVPQISNSSFKSNVSDSMCYRTC